MIFLHLLEDQFTITQERNAFLLPDSHFTLFYFIFGCAGLACCTAFSPAVADGGYSLVAACRLAVAPPLAEHGSRARGLQLVGSVAAAPRP